MVICIINQTSFLGSQVRDLIYCGDLSKIILRHFRRVVISHQVAGIKGDADVETTESAARAHHHLISDNKSMRALNKL